MRKDPSEQEDRLSRHGLIDAQKTGKKLAELNSTNCRETLSRINYLRIKKVKTVFQERRAL